MKYCTAIDVQSDFKNIEFSETSSLKLSEVEEIIEQESAFINGRISHVYKVPVIVANSPISFSILKRICVFLASDRVRHVLEVKTGHKATEQETKGERSLSRNPRKDLDDILTGKLKLADAESISGSVGFDTSDLVDCSTKVFDTNKQQW